MRDATRDKLRELSVAYRNGMRKLMRDKTATEDEKVEFVDATLRLDEYLKRQKLLDKDGKPMVK